MSKAKRRRQQQARSTYVRSFAGPVCRNCGQRGSHYVPPSLGDPGFWACAPIALGLDPSMGKDARVMSVTRDLDGSVIVTVDGVSTDISAFVHDMVFKGEHVEEKRPDLMKIKARIPMAWYDEMSLLDRPSFPPLKGTP